MLHKISEDRLRIDDLFEKSRNLHSDVSSHFDDQLIELAEPVTRVSQLLRMTPQEQALKRQMRQHIITEKFLNRRKLY